MSSNKLFLGIYNVYSSYDGKVSKEEWLDSIKDIMIKRIAEAEFLYYEGQINESYELLNLIIEDSKKEHNYDALIGSSSLLCRLALVLENKDVWKQGVTILCDNRKHNPLLCDFMLACVYSSLDYYEFALDFINKKT